MKLFKNVYMELALMEAKKAFLNNEVPVGAVIVNSKNEVIASAFNEVIALNDPTAHAEILAIKKAAAVIKNYRLNDCNIFVTLEPCPMCAGAILHARIKNLYFAAYDNKYGSVENKARIFSYEYPHKVNYYGGIYEEESMFLLKEFFKQKR